MCTGYGGIERGLELAGFKFRTILAVEIEAYVSALLAKKMEKNAIPAAPIWTDVKTLPSEMFRDRVSVLLAGYPCQPFSSAGKRQGTDDPRHLWPYIKNHIRTMRPVRCFFENVQGHISLGLQEVIGDLEAEGYRTTWGIFSAEQAGAPHQRKRVYIMADRKDIRCRGWANRHSDNQRGVQVDQEKKQSMVWGETARCSRDTRTELADTSGTRQQAFRDKPRAERSARLISEPSELADTNSQRLQGCERFGAAGKKGQSIGHPAECNTQFEERTRWPAGPGQSQYEWEEPRTIWKTKPELGGTLDGFANRVDRLRLLGNGVVPQTAAMAWLELSQRLKND